MPRAKHTTRDEEADKHPFETAHPLIHDLLWCFVLGLLIFGPTFIAWAVS
jgi:hypothetical protein